MKIRVLALTALAFFAIDARADENKYAPPLTLGQVRKICHQVTHGDLNLYDTCLQDHQPAIGQPVTAEDAKILNTVNRHGSGQPY